jgi:hypothetical protein
VVGRTALSTAVTMFCGFIWQIIDYSKPFVYDLWSLGA